MLKLARGSVLQVIEGSLGACQNVFAQPRPKADIPETFAIAVSLPPGSKRADWKSPSEPRKIVGTPVQSCRRCRRAVKRPTRRPMDGAADVENGVSHFSHAYGCSARYSIVARVLKSITHSQSFACTGLDDAEILRLCVRSFGCHTCGQHSNSRRY